MPFPADQTGNAVPRFHAATGENPVLVIGANPIGAARHRKGAASANQRGLVGSIVFQVQKFRESPFDGRFLNGAILANSANRSVGHPGRIRIKGQHAAASVAAEKCRMHSLVDRLSYVLEHVQRPILIMADG